MSDRYSPSTQQSPPIPTVELTLRSPAILSRQFNPELFTYGSRQTF